MTPVEAAVLETSSFQRLRNIRQLGLAHYVYPGADFSRLSHSLGVCHITKKTLDALRSSGVKLTDAEATLYPLAGLLHDIGHYPFSHALEEAIENHFKESVIVEPSRGASDKPAPTRFLSHEQVGKQILLRDEELRGILHAQRIEPEQVYKVFSREEPPRFSNLISSDLDADRLDYLLRTSVYTGLPYGSVDLPYILSHLALDNKDRICLHRKAIRAADHLLLSRFFDYQQVAFHKTVAAFEWVLKDVISDLLEGGRMDCSRDGIMSRIDEQRWPAFNDMYVLGLIQDMYDQETDETIKLRAEAILRRRPPKMVYSREYFAPRDKESKHDFTRQCRLIHQEVLHIADRLGIPKGRWHVWSKPGIALTKIGSHVTVSEAFGDERDMDRYEQAVRILDRSGNSLSIMEVEGSLMKVLCNMALYSVRVYALLELAEGRLRAEIQTQLHKSLED